MDTLEYKFNDSGVCINPDCIDIEERSYIKIAQYNNFYIYGFSLDYKGGGRSSPCSKYGEKFATREDCRLSALKHTIKIVELEIAWYENYLSDGHADNCGYGTSLVQCKKILRSLNDRVKLKPRYVQLDLFC